MEQISPPQPTRSFTDYFVLSNGLEDFVEWRFCPGMIFGATDKWWVRDRKRERPHEGLDLCLYANRIGRLCVISEGSKVPVMFDGQVAGIEDDFLGKSIWVRHELLSRGGLCLYTVYGHTSPADGIEPGDVLSEGDIFATIGSNGKAGVPYHLHITMLWAPANSQAPGWDRVGNNKDFLLVDPLLYVAGERWNFIGPDVAR